MFALIHFQPSSRNHQHRKQNDDADERAAVGRAKGAGVELMFSLPKVCVEECSPGHARCRKHYIATTDACGVRFSRP